MSLSAVVALLPVWAFSPWEVPSIKWLSWLMHYVWRFLQHKYSSLRDILNTLALNAAMRMMNVMMIWTMNRWSTSGSSNVSQHSTAKTACDVYIDRCSYFVIFLLNSPFLMKFCHCGDCVVIPAQKSSWFDGLTCFVRTHDETGVYFEWNSLLINPTVYRFLTTRKNSSHRLQDFKCVSHHTTIGLYVKIESK